MWGYPLFKESRKRSLVRSVIWRIIGIAVLAIVTYAFTKNWIITTYITLVHHGVFVFVYYAHERFWLRIKWLQHSKWKPFMRIITYEVILGNVILGIISYAFTGNLQTMTAITLTYISNKYWMYYAYDWIWHKINWEREIKVYD